MKKHLYFQRTAEGALEACAGGSEFAPVSKARAAELMEDFLDFITEPAEAEAEETSDGPPLDASDR